MKSEPKTSKEKYSYYECPKCMKHKMKKKIKKEIMNKINKMYRMNIYYPYYQYNKQYYINPYNINQIDMIRFSEYYNPNYYYWINKIEIDSYYQPYYQLYESENLNQTNENNNNTNNSNKNNNTNNQNQEKTINNQNQQKTGGHVKGMKEKIDNLKSLPLKDLIQLVEKGEDSYAPLILANRYYSKEISSTKSNEENISKQ